MKQRVNLQYSINIEELPAETRRLFLDAHKSLKHSISIVSSADESGNDILSSEGLKIIDDVRTAMMDADYILADIQNIIKGYLSYLSSDNTEQTATDEPVVGPELFQDPDLINDLQQKLELFQSNFEKESDTATPSELPE